MSDTVIRVENLGKKYIIGHQKQERYTALRDVIANRAKGLFKRTGAQAQEATEEFWALKDVSFEIKQGDRVGIIGRNGAGKSTLLKLLSRITEPTTGSIRVKGRVASLLEVGTGFHPELTGRENIFLNGAILGMSRVEIRRKFDEIVAFAEVEKFLDTPVKRYSSGMYVRLAFAVAAHLEPEILVVDEVLAVGDAQFQKKCLGKMGEVSQQGRTVLFVSHNIAAIHALCTRAIMLNKGSIVCDDSKEVCIDAYELSHGQEKGNIWVRPSSKKNTPLSIAKVASQLKGEQPNLQLEIDIVLESKQRHQPAFLAVDILDSASVGVMQALPKIEGFIKYNQAPHLINLSIKLPPLIPGRYLTSIWVGTHNTETLDQISEAVIFDVNDSPTPGRTFPHTKNHGYIVPECCYDYRLLEDSVSCIW